MSKVYMRKSSKSRTESVMCLPCPQHRLTIFVSQNCPFVIPLTSQGLYIMNITRTNEISSSFFCVLRFDALDLQKVDIAELA
jgi:hypothetical protein